MASIVPFKLSIVSLKTVFSGPDRSERLTANFNGLEESAKLPESAWSSELNPN
jgi:hypothetical protein